MINSYIVIFLTLIVYGLSGKCSEDNVYISVFKRNSPTSFNQRDETFSIKGVLGYDYVSFVNESPLVLFRQNHTYEYCLPRTEKLIYDIFLYDSKGNGWDDGSYIEIRSETGFLLFKGQCTNGEEQVYRIRLTYIISPSQNWGVLESSSYKTIWKDLSMTNMMLTNFDTDYLKEDENAEDYELKIEGQVSDHNFYVNRFFIDTTEYYAGLEVGMTNDFQSVSIYINNVLVYKEKNHKDNNKNYYRLLLSGTILQEGSNIIIFEFDKNPHLNNVYLYGYPVKKPSQCIYLPYSTVVDSSPVVEGHNVNLAFDYSTDYFYFNAPRDVYLTFNNQFFDVFTISQYSVFDYISAYAPRNWTLSGSNDLQTWTLLDRRDEPPIDHIFRKYDYSMNKENIPFAYYKYTILDNKGFGVVWLSELFPYICHTGYATNFYEPAVYALAYNIPKQIVPFMKDKVKDEFEFSIQPPLPYSMSLDSHTGIIQGSLGYEFDRDNYYVVTIKGHDHYQQQSLYFIMSEAYSFDSILMNDHVQVNNIYTKTPLFVLFIVFSSAVCILLFFFMELIQYMRL